MYFSPSCQILVRHLRFYVNDQDVTDRILCCDTELGFAICMVIDPENPPRPPFQWKKDAEGFRGRVATETIWGRVVIKALQGFTVERTWQNPWEDYSVGYARPDAAPPAR